MGGELSGKELVLVIRMIHAGFPAHGFLSSACLGFLTCPIAKQKVTEALDAQGSTLLAETVYWVYCFALFGLGSESEVLYLLSHM